MANTGKVAGADVPQLYLMEAPDAKRVRLLGFERVELAPGESRQVTLTADPRLLARSDGKASQWRITGSKGTVLWDGAESFDAHRVAADEGFLREQEDLFVPDTVNVYETHGHASVISAFLKAVETGEPPETAAEDNIRSLAMVFAAIESARTGQRVQIREGH